MYGVPNQMNLAVATSVLGPKSSANSSRKRLLAPSQTTTRSKSSSSAGSLISCWKRMVTPSARAWCCSRLSSVLRTTAAMPMPPTRSRAPWTRTSISSQCRPCFSSASLSTGSAASMASRVASEKTTPKPKVSSGRLRSNTTTSAPGRFRLSSVAKNSPPGPPPMQATLIVLPPVSQPRGQLR